MDSNYSLSDISAAMNGNGLGGNNLVTLLLLFALISGNGLFGNRGDYGQYATAASQQEILFGQHFQNLDNKIDRLGNGLADLGFSLNNSIKDGNAMVAGRVIDESRGIQNKLCELNTSVHAEGEATRAMIQQNKIDSLQGRVNQLELQAAMCGVVKYPNASTYNAGGSPFCNNNNGCGCNNI